MPLHDKRWIPHKQILTYEEIITIVEEGIKLGISKVRITGGEPLVRKDIIFLISKLSAFSGIEDLSLTTNGILLPKYAKQLKEAGLHRINISLDTLSSDKYLKITGGYGNLRDVWAGIQEVQKIGLTPVKINVVCMHGVNDDELIEFAKLTIEYPFYVRFIEFVSLDDKNKLYLPIKKVKFILEKTIGKLSAIDNATIGNGPAKYYKLPRAKGIIGFIAPISGKFCDRCNRLRLTSDGRILPCLLSNEGINIKHVLRDNINHSIADVLKEVVNMKQKRYPETSYYINMYRIGG
jgi:cyclic pyranopterin phosphate synthase